MGPIATSQLDVLELGQVNSLLQQLSLGEDLKTAAQGLATHVSASRMGSPLAHYTLDKLADSLSNPNSPTDREGALLAVSALSKEVGRAIEPFLVPVLPQILDNMADKVPAVRTAAQQAASTIVQNINPYAVPLLVPHLVASMDQNKKWQTKEGSMKLVQQLAKTAPEQVQRLLPELVPLVSDGVIDARAEVKKAAWSAMNQVFKLVGNRDIAPCLPALMGCIARPAEVSDAITKLSATTFVQQVEAPALAVMVPLLVRGFQKETPIKRKTLVIIANMAKLVNDPMDVATFLPKLLPRLEQAAEETSDPECRSVAQMAQATVLKIVSEGREAGVATRKVLDHKHIMKALKESIAAKSNAKLEGSAAPTLNYITSLCVELVKTRQMSPELWKTECVVPYLTPLMPEGEAEAADACQALLDRCLADVREHTSEDDEDDDGVDLCNCEFSLAYGGKILLNGARLRLKRGRRYGLCGANGVGKSTLMKAIVAGKVDGFPSKHEVRTAYVAHDIDGSVDEATVVDFICHDADVKATTNPNREEVIRRLTEVGFDDLRLQMPVTSLSGGWKMKLALARALLMKPDILLLDEPTNHLDVTNVHWLEQYLVSLDDVTIMTVSHDSGFLDNVCTDIIHYENRKLKRYKGNLSEFVKVKPEAKSYYELGAAVLKFTFPIPGFLDGITTKEKPVIRMKKVHFTYPGNPKPTLTDVTVFCSLGSRIAVLGKNGAGKSTLIKLLTGELKPNGGLVNRHPNARVAYVAQHAFHHIEEHLDKTPNQYIRQRYSSGEDKEENDKVYRAISKEEEDKIKNQIWMVDGQTRIFDKIVSRRKKRRSYEYEVAWKGLSSLSFNRWYTREELLDRGFAKWVNEFDGKRAAAGGDTRPLNQETIEKFLSDFGLDPEFGTHSHIRGLSGGQKVKLVLAAAMWHNPHMLIMDEPTNYLDRESLGALANAIKEFGGGVVLISHHSEFTSALCHETWHVEEGKVTVVGRPGTTTADADDK